MSKDSSEGGEIDREVAEKVMGWVYKPSVATVAPGFGKLPATLATYHTPDGKARLADSFTPSTRIDHAWEVVEKLRNDGHDIDVQFAHDDLMVWTAQIDDNTASCAKTAPLALCRAALQAVKDQPQ